MLKSTALCAAAMIVPRSVFGANDRLNLAYIGCGSRACSALIPAARDENIVAMCDPNEAHSAKALNRAREMGKTFRVFKDYRRMFDAVGSQIDAVAIATPDRPFCLIYSDDIQT